MKIPFGIRGKRLILNGYNDIGYHYSLNMVKRGALLTGVVTRDGSIECEKGI